MSASLKRTVLLAYSAPSLVTSVAALPMVLFVPAFYADTLGLPLAAVGVAIAVSRLLDVVTDPLIGVLSDRLRLPMGRRKPWMILGVPLFVYALWKVFVPGESATPAYLAIWSALLYLAFTMIDLPHKAWGAELSHDYDERSRVTSWREAISTAGQVALLGSLVWLADRGIEESGAQLRWIATWVAVALPAMVLWCVWGVREGRPEVLVRKRPSTMAGLRIVARNPAFLRMIGCVLFFVSGIAVQGTLHRMILADVMGDESRFATMILFENIATLAGVPVWLWISVRVGKHRALIAAALWIAALSLPLVGLRAGDTDLLVVLIVIRGSSFASILFLANSMAADVIDVDALEAGEQRSGLFFAVWGMVTKLSLTVGVLLGTTLPAAFGYEPSANLMSPEIEMRLMAIYGLVPAGLMATGVLFLVNFPITRERHATVQLALAKLRSS